MEFNVPFSAPSPHGYPPAFVPITPSQQGSEYINPSSSQDNYEACLAQADAFSALNFSQQYGAAQQHHVFFPSPPIHPSTLRHGPQALSPPVSDGSPVYMNGESVPQPDALGIGHRQDHGAELLGVHGGSEEDDSRTPAQSKRKAQNRAAQRAFRERKERHIRDLESKLANLEAAQKETATQNEQLRQNLHKISTENDILRATSSATLQHNSSGGGGGNDGSTGNSRSSSASDREQLTTGPMVYKPTDFYSNLLQGHHNQAPAHRISTSDDGQRLLAAGTTWDYIVGHDLYKKGFVDIIKVCDGIKHLARCDGQGPVFAENDIEAAILQAAMGGSDDLL